MATKSAKDGAGVLFDMSFTNIAGEWYKNVIIHDGSGNPITPASYAEDSAHQTGDAVVPMGAVRQNAKGTGLGANGDYANIQVNPFNEVYVSMEGAYETVAASQTAQTLGATGATGDIIHGILVVPATVSPGNILLLDNATSITVFAGGTNSVLTLHPFYIPLGMKSVSGAWKITTGANVSCIGIGNFT